MCWNGVWRRGWGAPRGVLVAEVMVLKCYHQSLRTWPHLERQLGQDGVMWGLVRRKRTDNSERGALGFSGLQRAGWMALTSIATDTSQCRSFMTYNCKVPQRNPRTF